MKTVLIVDDELLARERLKRLLAKMPGFRVVAEASDGLEVLPLLNQYRPDICLLDIHMPGLDGLQLANKLQSIQPAPAIIFCTAHDEHALQAFDYKAADYILKPIREERLLHALERAALLLNKPIEKSTDVLSVSTGSAVVRVAWSDILCLLAEDKYVTVVTAEARYLSNKTLKQFESEYADKLLRVHRNALVVINKVKGLVRTTDGYCVTVEGLEQRLDVSRRHAQRVRNMLTSEY